MADLDGAITRARAEILRRLSRAAAELAKELKVTVSVPAPRKVSKRTGRPYAATRATKGAPPRKLTGRGRAAVAWEVDRATLVGRVGVGAWYMARHERSGLHPWVAVTLARCRTRLAAVLSGRG